MEIWDVAATTEQVEGLNPDGSPDPAYAAALGLVQAPIRRRVVASLIDAGGLVLVQVPSWFLVWPLVLKLIRGRITWFGFTNHPDFTRAMIVLAITVGLSVAYCLANVMLNGVRGLTLGKAIVGLRNVNVTTLGRPGVGRAMLRALLIAAPALVVVGPILVLMTPLWDSTGRNRGWADLAARMWMVDIRAGLNPYDDKRMRIARKTYTADPVAPRAPLPSLTSAEAGTVYRPAGRVSAGVLASSASSSDLRGTPALQRARTPLIPPSYQPPIRATRAARAPLLVVLDTGERIEFGVAVVIGRGPVLSDATAGATPIPITDTTYSVSKTHLLIRRTPAGAAGEEGLEVVDQSSTNGTFLLQAGVERALRPGEPTAARVGDTIRFGERTLVVQRSMEEKA